MHDDSPIMRLFRDWYFPGKGRLLDRWVPHTGIRQTTLFGWQIHLDLSDLIQRRAFIGTYEPAESRVVRANLRPGMTFVDVGANIGFYSLLAKSRVGAEGRVIAFEPGPYAIDHLRRTITENQGRLDIDLVPAALGDTTGDASLYVGGWGNYTPTLIPNGGGQPVTVRTTTLDTALAERGIDHVDLLKIDVEGFEFQVFKGARNYLGAGRIRRILAEFNAPCLQGAGSSVEELAGFLGSMGFEEELRTGEGSDLENRFLVHRSIRTG